MIRERLKQLYAGGTPFMIFLFIYTIIALFLAFSGEYRTSYSGSDDISFTEGWTDALGHRAYPDQLDSLSAQTDSGTIIIHNTIPQLNTDMFLSFYTYGAFFSVDIDGETIYTYDYRPIFTAGHSYGTDFHNILISQKQSGKTITFTIHLIYGSGASFIDMVLGKSSEFIIRYLRNMLPSLILSLVIIIFGILIFMISKSAAEDPKIQRSLRAFSLMSVEIGLWATIETQVLTLIYGHAEFFRSYDYLLLMLLPYPMSVVGNGWLEKSSDFFENLIKWLVIGNIALSAVLRFAFDLDLHQLHLLIHIVLLFTLISIILMAINNILYKQKRHIIHRHLRLWIGITILIICSIIDMVRYNMTDKTSIDAAQFTRIGFLFLMYFFLSQYMREAQIRLRRAIEAETYRQIAYRDELTGVGSRAAFEAKEKELNVRLRSENLHVLFVSIDVNYLKKVNDTYGHAAGDAYLVACVDVLRSSFEDFGSIYRIGGDEFAIFIEGDQAEEIYAARLAHLHTQLNSFAVTDTVQLIPSFAIGSELISSTDMRNLETAEKIADARMYENKQTMKAARTD